MCGQWKGLEMRLVQWHLVKQLGCTCTYFELGLNHSDPPNVVSVSAAVVVLYIHSTKVIVYRTTQSTFE